jgi:hypothetical protein
MKLLFCFLFQVDYTLYMVRRNFIFLTVYHVTLLCNTHSVLSLLLVPNLFSAFMSFVSKWKDFLSRSHMLVVKNQTKTGMFSTVLLSCLQKNLHQIS